MTAIKRCEKCDGIIKSYDKVIYVDDGAGYVYHEGCVAMHPARWAVYDGEYFLGMTDDYNRLACDVLGEGEYEEGME